MYDEGYETIHNIDISDIVIDQMKERNLQRPNMKCNPFIHNLVETMDALNLKYKDGFFDYVIDKSFIKSFIKALLMLYFAQSILLLKRLLCLKFFFLQVGSSKDT